jgi:PadR family transcriptional regulator, regulatory protein PadR
MNDETPITRKFRKELMTGLSSLVLLIVMGDASREMYGYEIAKAMKLDGDDPLFKQGAVYPVLRSLHAMGLLDSRVEASASGPPRRYYQITEDGRKALAEWLTAWRDLRGFVDNAINCDGGSQ